jgi:hypothetical protein
MTLTQAAQNEVRESLVTALTKVEYSFAPKVGALSTLGKAIEYRKQNSDQRCVLKAGHTRHGGRFSVVHNNRDGTAQYCRCMCTTCWDLVHWLSVWWRAASSCGVDLSPLGWAAFRQSRC